METQGPGRPQEGVRGDEEMEDQRAGGRGAEGRMRTPWLLGKHLKGKEGSNVVDFKKCIPSLYPDFLPTLPSLSLWE